LKRDNEYVLTGYRYSYLIFRTLENGLILFLAGHHTHFLYPLGVFSGFTTKQVSLPYPTLIIPKPRSSSIINSEYLVTPLRSLPILCVFSLLISRIHPSVSGCNHSRWNCTCDFLLRCDYLLFLIYDVLALAPSEDRPTRLTIKISYILKPQ
jgi:hypothetical protein